MSEKPTPETVTHQVSRNEQERLMEQFNELGIQLKEPGMHELVRLLESNSFDSLTEKQITEVGNYHAITIGEKRFFDKAFSTSKEAADILRIAQRVGREPILQELKTVQEDLLSSEEL